MSNVAVYTFGLLDPAAEPTRLAELVRRGAEIYAAVDQAPGLVDRAGRLGEGATAYASGEDFGRWGIYTLPSDLPGLEGHDVQIHIATLSFWRDVESARRFVYRGLHAEALKVRHDWFLKGPWPGYVLWHVDDGVVPNWFEGVSNLQALVRIGESIERFTFRNDESFFPIQVEATAAPASCRSGGARHQNAPPPDTARSCRSGKL